MKHALPGCFSVPSVYFFDSPVCQACKITEDCRAQVTDKLEGLKVKSLAVQRILDDISLQAAKGGAKVSFAQSLDVELRQKMNAMPQQAARYYQTLLKRGIDKLVPNALAKRENPFSEYGNRGAYLAFELLLAEGGFNRVSLTKHLVQELGSPRNSAASQAAMIWHAFLALGILEKTPGENWACFVPCIGHHNLNCLKQNEIGVAVS